MLSAVYISPQYLKEKWGYVKKLLSLVLRMGGLQIS